MITTIIMGQSPKGSDISSEKRNDSLEFHQGKISFTNWQIGESGKFATNFNKVAPENSLLVCVRAPVGDVNFTNRKIAIGRGLCAIKPSTSFLDTKYLYYMLLDLKKYFLKKGKGSTFDAITIDVLKHCIIPLPSIKYQRQIVAALDDIFSLLNYINSNQEEISNLVATIKAKILDYFFGDNSSYKSYYEKEIDITEDIIIFDNLRKPINHSEREKRLLNSKIIYPYYGATGQVGSIDDYIFDGEYILLGEDGAPFLDKFAVKAYLIVGKSWVNNHVHVLKSKSNNKFLMYYLNWIDYTNLVTGSTRLKLNQANLKKIKYFDVPAEIKNEIVSKIEILFKIIESFNI